MSDLKPCPKCGGEAKVVKRKSHRARYAPWQVECREFLCHTIEGPERLKREAIAAWNRRDCERHS